MTDVLDRAVAAIRMLPEADRNSMAEAILTLSAGGARLEPEPEHLPAVIEGLAQIERGEVIEGTASELVEAAFRRHRP